MKTTWDDVVKEIGRIVRAKGLSGKDLLVPSHHEDKRETDDYRGVYEPGLEASGRNVSGGGEDVNFDWAWMHPYSRRGDRIPKDRDSAFQRRLRRAGFYRVFTTALGKHDVATVDAAAGEDVRQVILMMISRLRAETVPDRKRLERWKRMLMALTNGESNQDAIQALGVSKATFSRDLNLLFERLEAIKMAKEDERNLVGLIARVSTWYLRQAERIGLTVEEARADWEDLVSIDKAWTPLPQGNLAEYDRSRQRLGK